MNPDVHDVLIVRTGTANLASVLAALRRAGAKPVVTEDRAKIEAAKHVVLPGVGAFGAAMHRLGELGLRDVLTERVVRKRSTLAICLGFQILCQGSDESPGVKGLGVWSERVGRFVKSPRVPQLGWNRMESQAACKYLKSGYVYFANSFRVAALPQGMTGATAEYGESFVAAIESGGVLACQFHPELSGAFGQQILRRWLENPC